ncbi:MAG: dihydrodipicolinate synthase family protein [Chloroflexota bacterium]
MSERNLSPFEGVFALLLTPFQPDGQIDWSCYDQYVDWQLSHQPQGLFTVCGSGEMNRLTLDERLALAKRTVQRAGKIPVVATANIGPNYDTHADEIAQMVDTGVAGIVLVLPEGLNQNQAQLEAYFGRLADQASCPIILYEWPGVQPCEIEADVYGRLVSEHAIYGIKDTTCTLEGIQGKLDAAPNSIVYQANTPYLLKAVKNGTRGIMAITSTAATDLLVEFWQAAIAEKVETATSLHQQLVMLDAVLRFGYPASAKYLLQLRGLPFALHCRSGSTLSQEGAKAMSVWWGSVQSRS